MTFLLAVFLFKKLGYRPVHGIPGSQPVAPTAGPRPVMQSAPQPNAKIQFQQPKSKTSVLDNSQAFQLTDGEQNVLQSSPPGIIDAENKVLATCKLHTNKSLNK